VYRAAHADWAKFITVCRGPLGPEAIIGHDPPHDRLRWQGDVMKVMVFVKATKESESGAPPDPKVMEAMGRYNEALTAAGILQEQILGGLKPTRFAKRVHFSGKNRTVIDGPFAETKELVAGFWLWEVKSIEEAVEWAKQCPNPMPTDSDIDIRPLYSLEDLEKWRDSK